MIDAHIIPDNVLFLGPTVEGEQFKTSAYTDMLKVSASLSSATEGDKVKCKIFKHLFEYNIQLGYVFDVEN